MSRFGLGRRRERGLAKTLTVPACGKTTHIDCGLLWYCSWARSKTRSIEPSRNMQVSKGLKARQWLPQLADAKTIKIGVAFFTSPCANPHSSP